MRVERCRESHAEFTIKAMRILPDPLCRSDQPVTTAVAECNRPLGKLHNSVGNRR